MNIYRMREIYIEYIDNHKKYRGIETERLLFNGIG